MRISGGAAIAVAVAAFFAIAPGCSASASAGGAKVCPGFALNDPWVLRGERAAVILIGLTGLVPIPFS